MSEFDEAVILANRVLDRSSADPDDDLAILARQFLRQVELVARLKKDLVAQHDPMGDLINANRDEIMNKYQEALRRVRRLLDSDEHAAKRLAIKVIEAVTSFHPMHSESWCGWPETEATK